MNFLSFLLESQYDIKAAKEKIAEFETMMTNFQGDKRKLKQLQTMLSNLKVKVAEDEKKVKPEKKTFSKVNSEVKPLAVPTLKGKVKRAVLKDTTKYKTDVARKAAQIKADLRLNFPGVKFSVSSENYSMGSSINVSWHLGPSEEDVSKVTSYVENVRRDEYTGEILSGGNRYVFLNRKVPDEMNPYRIRVNAEEILNKAFPGADIRVDETGYELSKDTIKRIDVIWKDGPEISEVAGKIDHLQTHDGLRKIIFSYVRTAAKQPTATPGKPDNVLTADFSKNSGKKTNRKTLGDVLTFKGKKK